MCLGSKPANSVQQSSKKKLIEEKTYWGIAGQIINHLISFKTYWAKNLLRPRFAEQIINYANKFFSKNLLSHEVRNNYFRPIKNLLSWKLLRSGSAEAMIKYAEKTKTYWESDGQTIN